MSNEKLFTQFMERSNSLLKEFGNELYLQEQQTELAGFIVLKDKDGGLGIRRDWEVSENLKDKMPQARESAFGDLIISVMMAGVAYVRENIKKPKEYLNIP